MGIKERISFKVEKDEKKKDIFNLEGRGISIALTLKSWSWFQTFLKPNLVTLTESGLVAANAAIGSSAGGIPANQSISITGRYGKSSDLG